MAWPGGARRAWYPPRTDVPWRIAGNVNLCGFRFSPVRDPQRFPVCPKCKELAGMLWGSD
ncbi:MAG TPA: DUF3039 domain-containing protein [Actinomycetes bacterium]|nr:DUF3039 domain-containing protein [Actinomycetes bacterium]